ncbi:hypothetical protein GLOTRDRAFT_141531 [Gloeophyllum trabeum ATCC 11539]|uniref:Uncharacterized protein n=1 Tax=Gloeophyllum trabeum (strain ATCC 11539 / FP-39264 / Madison 617) TaxID=670483 RepID=S7R7X4_GLOTA|nr:uncharacterized protein GLOTRDRAFT_141531 [Gloeophyllum trabeum ATCC 11539]EPQ50450.1 hypothetical protein GLOTRDRAFT_141531 [Gloeophyllum trabeum ATCC 11539]
MSLRLFRRSPGSDNYGLEEKSLNSEREREEAFQYILWRQDYEALQLEIKSDAGERLRAEDFRELCASIDASRASAKEARARVFEEAQEAQEHLFESKLSARKIAFDEEMRSAGEMILYERKMQEEQSSSFIECRKPLLEQARRYREAVCASLKDRFEEQFDTLLKPWVEAFHLEFEALQKERIDAAESAESAERAEPGEKPVDDRAAQDSGPTQASNMYPEDTLLHPYNSSEVDHTPVPRIPDGTPRNLEDFKRHHRSWSNQGVASPAPITVLVPETSSGPGWNCGSTESKRASWGSLNDPVPIPIIPPLPPQGQVVCGYPLGKENGPSEEKIRLDCGQAGQSLLCEEIFKTNQAQREYHFNQNEQRREQRWAAAEAERDGAEHKRDDLFNTSMSEAGRKFTQEMETYDNLFRQRQEMRSATDSVWDERFDDAISRWTYTFETLTTQIDARYVTLINAQEDSMRMTQATVEDVIRCQKGWLREMRDKEASAFEELQHRMDVFNRHITRELSRDEDAPLVGYIRRASVGCEDLEAGIGLGEMGADPRDESSECSFPAPPCLISAPSSQPIVIQPQPASGVGIRNITAPTYITCPLPTPGDYSDRKKRSNQERRRTSVFQQSQNKKKETFENGIRKRQQEFAIREASRQHVFSQKQESRKSQLRAQEASQADTFSEAHRRRASEFQMSENDREEDFRNGQRGRERRLLEFIKARTERFLRNQGLREAQWRRTEDNGRRRFSTWEQDCLTLLARMVEDYKELFRDDERNRHLRFRLLTDQATAIRGSPNKTQNALET